MTELLAPSAVTSASYQGRYGRQAVANGNHVFHHGERRRSPQTSEFTTGEEQRQPMLAAENGWKN